MATNDAIAPLSTDAQRDQQARPVVLNVPDALPQELAADIARNLHRGEMEQAIGRPSQAKQYYQRVVRADPGNVVAHRRLAKIAASNRDYRQAERHLRAALEIRPNAAALWTDLARCLNKQHQFAAAEQAMRQGIALNRTPPRREDRNPQTSLPNSPRRRGNATADTRTASLADYRHLAGVSAWQSKQAKTSEDPPLLPAAIVHRRRIASERIAPVQLASVASLIDPDEVAPAEFTANAPGTDGNLPLWNPRP